MNDSIIRLIRQSVRYFRLNLEGLNVLLTPSIRSSAIFPLIANISGAKNVVVQTNDPRVQEEIIGYQNHLGLNNNFHFIESPTPEFLKQIDIVAKGDNMFIDKAFVSSLNENAVISLYPKNFDFTDVSNIDTEACTDKKIPVVAVNPADYSLMLYRYFAHIIVKRCYQVNLDVYRSRLLLIGHGDMLDNTMSHLKMSGAQVYAVHTDKEIDKAYISKHLPEMDAIVLVDYPNKGGNLLGYDSAINIDELMEINPDIKVIHVSGKVTDHAIVSSKISFTPQILTSTQLNIAPNEIGLRLICEASTATLKAAEAMLLNKNNSLQKSESIVSYDIVNANLPVVLGKVLF